MKKIYAFTFTIICALTALLTSGSNAKDGYSIKVHLIGVRDTMVFLANHFGDKQYIQDSCRADAQGRLKFESKTSLRGGMYLVVLPSKKYFEVIADKEQFFSVEADTTLDPSHVKFKDSQDNIDFYGWLNYLSAKRKEIEALQVKLNTLAEAERKDSKIKKDIQKSDDDIQKYQDDYIAANPKSMLTVIFKATREVDVPDAPILPNGQKDSTFQFYYYKNHYFDNIDFGDARLLRTPLFHQKLDYYIHKLTVQMADSINMEADKLVKLAQKDTEMFKYTVWYITHNYETSNIMGLDAVFVHMVKAYYSKEQAYWLSDADLFKIQDRAKQLDPILIGKKARNIILNDSSEHAHSLYEVNSPYTILFFWDPDCGHCKKSIPKLVDFYKEYRSKGVEVFAVCTEVEIEKWKKFIKENNIQWINVSDPKLHDNFRYDFDLSTTPQIFVLDKDKIIRAKKLDVEQIGDFIKHDKQIKMN